MTDVCFDVQALHEDIELRKQNIEQAILNGLELLKQSTGEIKETTLSQYLEGLLFDEKFVCESCVCSLSFRR